MASALNYMPPVTITVKNGEDLAAQFREIGKKLSRGICLPILKEAANTMVPAMRSNIRSVSGALSKGVKTRAGKADRPGRVSIIIGSSMTAESFAKRKAATRSTKRAAGVMARHAGRESAKYNVFYGYIIESGHKAPSLRATSRRASKYAPTQGVTPPHKWATPVFDAMVDSVGDSIETKLVQQFDER